MSPMPFMIAPVSARERGASSAARARSRERAAMARRMLDSTPGRASPRENPCGARGWGAVNLNDASFARTTKPGPRPCGGTVMEVDEATPEDPSERPEPVRGALRPRERLREQGPTALSDAELLALVLGSGVPGRSATRVGRQLARRHPSEL